MVQRILKARMRLMSRCERDGLFFVRQEDESSGSARLSMYVSSLQAKRMQVIERLLERTLSNYMAPNQTNTQRPE